MTEKIGLIKNPLTIIAIFAGIAEVSGTIVLPFIAEKNQELFIYFLIFFPSTLVILFFGTLNLNNKVLYAPSDYKDENNYIRINKFDNNKQQNIQIEVAKKDVNKLQEYRYLTNKIEDLNRQIELMSDVKSSNKFEIERLDYNFLVTNFDNVENFIELFKTDKIYFKPYISEIESTTNNYSAHRAIWLGRDIDIETVKLVLKKSKSFYPHLKYIHLSQESDPKSIFKQIYIGGSTESAIRHFNCIPLNNKDFEKIQDFANLTELHEYIEGFSG